MDLIIAWDLIWKTFVVFFVLIVAIRIMGKREIGEISAFDIVIFFVISELFSLALSNSDLPIWHSLIPVCLIVLLQIITAYLSLKYRKFRKKIDGGFTFLIYKGELDQFAMKKERYNIDDLMLQLRSKDIQILDEVEYAILENNGTLNVIKKANCKLDYPEPLIADGIINEKALKKYGKDKNWLLREIKKENYTSPEELFLVLALKQGIYTEPRKKPIDEKAVKNNNKKNRK